MHARHTSVAGAALPAALAVLFATAFAVPLPAQQDPQKKEGDFNEAAASVTRQLEESLAELDELRRQVAAHKIPLSQRLNQLERELIDVRDEYQDKARRLDNSNLKLNTLQTDIKSRKEENVYLQNLLAEYARNFETRLIIAEKQRYKDALAAARLATENTNLSPREVFQAQANLLNLSIDRLFEALGGTKFKGSAADANGMVKDGTYALVGPVALFRSADGKDAGIAQERLNSVGPSLLDFRDAANTAAVAQLVETGEGRLPFDATLGDAHKIEATEETFVEHVRKGGPVMVPIFALAGLALLVALYKWLGMAFLRRPSRKKVTALLEAVGRGDQDAAAHRVRMMKGPIGRMLTAGVEHLNEPRELVEEVMYETVLTTRLKLQRMLPFIAVCAAAAPLLGLLGTVTGIINTFKLITVFGSGDPKMLSGGISEALITTKFGLIVAIPALLLHAFLSRKARGVVAQMEKIAVAFMNHFAKAPRPAGRHAAGIVEVPMPDPDLVRVQVNEILKDLLEPVLNESPGYELARTRTAPPPGHPPPPGPPPPPAPASGANSKAGT